MSHLSLFKPNWILAILIRYSLTGKTRGLAVFNGVSASFSATKGGVIQNMHTGFIGLSGSKQCQGHL